MEREKARQRTHDALVRKARAGYVAGGSVYGYDNVEVTVSDAVTGKPKRLHVERRINEGEAAVIREIFEKAAAGSGTRRIAHDLNARGVPAPPPRRAGRPRAWAPSTIYAMLTRALYRGEVVWNRSRKRDTWGIQHQTGRAEAEWVQLEMPDLRIVPEPLWQAVRERFSRHAGVVPPGDERTAVGPPSQRHRVAVPPDRLSPVRALRGEPRRPQPGFRRPTDLRLPLQLPSSAREHRLSRRARPPDGSE